jgi:ankyrin repeat protein
MASAGDAIPESKVMPNSEHEQFKRIDRGDHIGFPPLIAALSCSRTQPGSSSRPDVLEIMTLLLEFGADPNERGINDYTPLHMAVSERNLPAVRLLLEVGADPALRTRIDDCETPYEMAVDAGLSEIAKVLRAKEEKRKS